MERLTYDFCVKDKHCWQVKGADNELCEDVCKKQADSGCERCPIKKAFDRLAAYEDTGLTPEEIVALIQPPNDLLTLEELREMGGEPYWHIGLRDDSPPPHWAILPSYVAQRPQDYFYGKHWLAYRRRQEEEYC